MNTQQQQGASYTAPSASSPSPSPRSQRPYSPKEHSAQQGYPADLTIEDLDKDSGGASAPLDLADSSQGSGWSQSDTGVAYGRQDGGDEDREEPSTKKKQKAKGTATSSAQASEGGDKIRLWTRRAERMVCYKSLVKHRPSGAKGHKATREAWLGVVKDCLTPQHIRVRTDDGVQEVWVDMSHKCKDYTRDEVAEKAKGFFDSRRRNFLNDRKKDESKTGEGAEEADELADEEDSEEYQLAQACLAWEQAKENKSAGIFNKEDSRRAIDARDRAQDALPCVGKGKGSARGAGKKHGEGGSGGGGSSDLRNFPARVAAGKAARNRSRGGGCRFRGNSDDDDKESSSSGDGGDGSGAHLSDEDSRDADEDLRALDEQDMVIPSGSAGWATRRGRGGGKRHRSVGSLNPSTSEQQVQELLVSCVKYIMKKPAGGGGGSGGSAENGNLEALVQQVKQVNAGVQQIMALVLQQAQQQAYINTALLARLDALGVQAPVAQPGFGMLGGLGGVLYPPTGGTGVQQGGGGGSRGASAVAVGGSQTPAGVGPLPFAVAQGASAAGAPPASTSLEGAAVAVGERARNKTRRLNPAVGAGGAGAGSSPPELPGFPTGTRVPLCNHGIQCVREEVKTGTDAGWVFFRCGKHDRHDKCSFHEDVVPRGSARDAARGGEVPRGLQSNRSGSARRGRYRLDFLVEAEEKVK